MEYILEQLAQLDLGQILVMGVMLWVMYTRLLGKMDKVEERLGNKIKEVDDKLSSEIQKVDDKLSIQIQKVDDKLSAQIQKVEDKLSAQIQKLDEKVTDIDRRVCRMEGAFNNKECCMIKDSSQLRKAD